MLAVLVGHDLAGDDAHLGRVENVLRLGSTTLASLL
jgi:hypothetical protein